MTQYFFSPVWNSTRFTDTNNNLLANGTITTYEGGSFTIEQETFSTMTGTANPNPIVLDANGLNTTPIWLIEGVAYNFVLRDVNGNQIDTAVDIYGVQPSSVPSGGNAISVWNESAAPTYISSTEFSLPGNVTADYAVGNRVQFVNGGSVYGYGTVTAVVYSSPNTYVTLQNDSTAIGSNVTAVSWSSLVANGITVDAAGVSFATDIPYAGTNTVGGQINTLYSTIAGDIATVDLAIADRNVVYTTAGTFASGGTAYTLTPTPAATSLTTNEVYSVKFNVAGGTTPSLNISGLGAQALVQLNSAGAYIAAVITAGQTSVILNNGTQYVLQNPAPADASGTVSLTTNGWWKPPGGPVIQWGTFTSSASDLSITFPIAFPHAVFSVTTSQPGSVSYGYTSNVVSPTTTGFEYHTNQAAGSAIFWQAVGW